MEILFTYAKRPVLALPQVQGFMHEVVEDLNRETVIQLLGILTILFFVYRIAIIIHNVWFHPLSKFPGPTHMAAFYLPYTYGTFLSGRMHHTMKKLHRKYGPIIRVGPNHLAVDGSIAWPEVFGHKTDKEEYGKLPGFLFAGDTISIIGAPKDMHRRQRRQLGHAFSDGALRDQGPIIQSYVNLLMERFTEKSEAGKSFDVNDWFNFTTFDVIGHLTHSKSFNCLENGSHPWISEFFRGFRGRSYAHFLSQVPYAFEIVKALHLIRDITNNEKDKNDSVQRTIERIKMGDYAIEGYRDFTSYMLKKNHDGESSFVGLELLASATILIGAGAETTAATMSALIFYLGITPTAYNRLVEEIRSAFDDEESITITSTQQLEYLHACIEESLRMYPPINETPPRVCPGDTIDGKYVPRGTAITVFQEVTYHNPEHFAEPDSYIPERWLPKSLPFYDAKFDNDNRAVFKPFSYGPRDCIGKNLAYSEMRLTLSRMLYRFDVELVPGQENWHSAQRTFMAWERRPLNIYLKRR
ncbi:cytochrome P450 [Trichoderma afarasin]